MLLCVIVVLRLVCKCCCSVLVVGLVDFLSLFVPGLGTSQAGILQHDYQQHQHVLYQHHCQHHVRYREHCQLTPSSLSACPCSWWGVGMLQTVNLSTSPTTSTSTSLLSTPLPTSCPSPLYIIHTYVLLKG